MQLSPATWKQTKSGPKNRIVIYSGGERKAAVSVSNQAPDVDVTLITAAKDADGILIPSGSSTIAYTDFAAIELKDKGQEAWGYVAIAFPKGKGKA